MKDTNTQKWSFQNKRPHKTSREYKTQWDKVWLDSKGVTQGKWTKGMLDMNQWIMSRIKKFTEGFSIYDNTQDIKESHDTMRHDLLGCFNKFLS
jgi:hypothetical protein